MYLFGRLGTVATWGSASLRLLDGLWSDWRGRRVSVSGDGSRNVLAAVGGALRECVEQPTAGDGTGEGTGGEDAAAPQSLTPRFPTLSSCRFHPASSSLSDVLDGSTFSYVDPSGALRGPFSASRVARWARRGAFARKGFPLRHDRSGCWLSAWLLAEWEEEVEERKVGLSHGERTAESRRASQMPAAFLASGPSEHAGGARNSPSSANSGGARNSLSPTSLGLNAPDSDSSDVSAMDWAWAADDLAAVRATASSLVGDAMASRVLRGEAGGAIAVDDGDWMALDQEEIEEERKEAVASGMAHADARSQAGAASATHEVPTSVQVSSRAPSSAFSPARRVSVPVRLVLVLDTSAALARWSLLERLAEEFTGAAARESAGGASRSGAVDGGERSLAASRGVSGSFPFTVFSSFSSSSSATLYVPWVTLCELDALKDRERTSRAARAVLRRIEALSGGRDALVRVQGPKEASQAAASALLPRVQDARETLSDDAIVATALQMRGRLGEGCLLLLVTEDGGMLVRGRAAGLRVVRPAAVPRTELEVGKVLRDAGCEKEGEERQPGHATKNGAHGDAQQRGADAAQPLEKPQSCAPLASPLQGHRESATRHDAGATSHVAGRCENDAVPCAATRREIDAPSYAVPPRISAALSGAPSDFSAHRRESATQHPPFCLHAHDRPLDSVSPRESMHVESPRGDAHGVNGNRDELSRLSVAIGDVALAGPGRAHASTSPGASRPASSAAARTSASSPAASASRLFERASQCLPAALEAARRSLLGDLWLESLPAIERPPWPTPLEAAGYLLEHVRTHTEVADALRKEDHVVRRHPELYAPLGLDEVPRRWRRSAEERPALAALYRALEPDAAFDALSPLALLHLTAILQRLLGAAQSELESEPAPRDPGDAAELWHRGRAAAVEGEELCGRARELLERLDTKS